MSRIIKKGDLVKDHKRNIRVVITNITKVDDVFVIELKTITGFGRLKFDSAIKSKSLEDLSKDFIVLDDYRTSLAKRLVSRLNKAFNVKDTTYENGVFISNGSNLTISKNENSKIQDAHRLAMPILKQVILFYELLSRDL